MELYEEILIEALRGKKLKVVGMRGSVEKIVEMECYKALRRIREVLSDDSLEDKECFAKIEEIVRAFEDIGAHAGGRHDFG